MESVISGGDNSGGRGVTQVALWLVLILGPFFGPDLPPSGAGSRRGLFIHRLPVDRRLDRGNLLSKCRLHAEVEWVIVVQCPFAEKKGLSLFRVSCLGYKKR